MNIKCNVDNIGRDCHSIVSRGLGRNKEYLKRLIEREQLLCTRPVKSRHRKNLFQIIDCLNDIYPGNWEMLFIGRNYGGKRVYVPVPTILFSNVKVENSEGDSIFIKEVLVSLILETRTGGIKITEIRGSRPHLDYTQWINNYAHSHLVHTYHTDYHNTFRASNFCLGASEIIDLKSQLRVDYTNDLFRLFLLTLNSLVYWESLEGVPHVKMRNVRLTNHNEYNFNDLQGEINECSQDLMRFINKDNKLDLGLSVVNNRIKLNSSGNLYETIKDILIKKRDRSYYQYVLGKISMTSRRKKWRIPNSNSIRELPNFRNSEGELPFVYIQGRKLEFKVEEPDSNHKVDLNDLDVHPKLVENVSERIEKRIEDQIYRANTTKRLYKLKNARLNTQPDQVLV